MKSSTQPCPHCGKEGTIPYYYIGIYWYIGILVYTILVYSKLKLLCKDPEMCRKMTCQMKEKDHCFYENSSEDWGWEIKKSYGMARGFPSYHGSGTQMKVGLTCFLSRLKMQICHS